MTPRQQKSDTTGSEPAPLVTALRRILRPLVRLLVARSIPYTNVADVLRWVYVDVASKDFEIEGKPQTDSRVSLLTGVHRREVKRLRRHSSPAFRAPKSASMGAQLVSKWTTAHEYLDHAGAPRPLPYMSPDSNNPTFESLVRSVSTDIRPRVVIDEWVRLGVVHVDDDDVVHLDTDAFIPTHGADEMAYYFGRNLHDHIAAGVHNLLGEGAPYLERSVYYNNLGGAAVDELQRLAKEEGMRGLRAVNERAAELQQRDAGSEGAHNRINFGIYCFTEDRGSPVARGGEHDNGDHDNGEDHGEDHGDEDGQS